MWSAEATVKGAARAQDHYCWLSHDACRLQWRARDMAAKDRAPSGFLVVRDLCVCEIKHRKGRPVLLLKTPERRLALEFAEGGDVAPTAWAATLAYLRSGGV